MIVPRLVLDVFRPAAEVLGVVPLPVVEPLEVAAGAEVAEPPEVLGAALLPHAAKSATAPAAPAAAHHRLRISISPFGQMFVLPPFLQHVCRAANVHERSCRVTGGSSVGQALAQPGQRERVAVLDGGVSALE
jgi:hypothetical protein